LALRGPVRGRQKIDEPPQFDQRLDIVIESEIRDARTRRMGQRAA
jgi:hypothetical protein